MTNFRFLIQGIAVVLVWIQSSSVLGQSKSPPSKVAKVNRFVLPSRAKLKILATQRDETDPTSKSCAGFQVSEAEIRQMFLTYRELTSREVHDQYLWAPCFVDGTVAIDSHKSFVFRIRPGHTLETNFPSGKPVVLGGEPTDSPSGK